MPPKAPTDFRQIRTTAIIAIFSVDILFNKVALKGGNALTLVYEMSARTSLDLDFSIEADFEDLDDVQRRIFAALIDRYGAGGFSVFDLKFEKKPAVVREGQSPRWGGYMISFKLMERERYEAFRDNLAGAQREALVVGPAQQRTFTIDLSKHEYTKGKRKAQVDDFAIYVYSPEMIVIEKIRAICQQMPEYGQRRYATPRARDFFDIHLVLSKIDIDLSSEQNLDLARCIFEAKEVPLGLIPKISTQREFHRQDWENVRASTAEAVEDFDYYFDYVVERTKLVQALWEK
jgi:predicted nucleotidyltransferase component of viral defense system